MPVQAIPLALAASLYPLGIAALLLQLLVASCTGLLVLSLIRAATSFWNRLVHHGRTRAGSSPNASPPSSKARSV